MIPIGGDQKPGHANGSFGKPNGGRLTTSWAGFSGGGAVDPLDGVAIFVAVAECGSFSAAAEKLGCAKSTVSAGVTRLECRVGARLLRRSTKSVTLTEAGRAYLCRIDTVLDQVRQAEQAAQAEAREARGPLRVSVPAPFAATHLAPLLPEFLDRHPDIRVEMQVTTEVVDLVACGFDLAIRLCPTVTPDTVIRRLGVTRLVPVAAPSLLNARGMPMEPADLAGWPCLVNPGYPARERDVWRLCRDDAEQTVALKPVLVANDVTVLHRLARDGCGATLIGEYVVAADLADGALVRLLPDWQVVDIPVLAIYPDNRLIAAKVRAFVDYLARRLDPLCFSPAAHASTPISTAVNCASAQST